MSVVPSQQYAVSLNHEAYIVRVRGLPYSCTENELIDFFQGVCINSVHFTKNKEGRPSGEAYVVLASLRDRKEAIKLDKASMGSRYVEVFEARYSEMSWMLTKEDRPVDVAKIRSYEHFEPATDNIIKMRGMPFEAGGAEIERFFEGLQLKDRGILICKDGNGRPSGEGYAEFVTEQHQEEGMGRNNNNMGHRYIELFQSSKAEALRAKDRSENGGGDWDSRSLGRGGAPKEIGYEQQKSYGGGPMRSAYGGGVSRIQNPYERSGGGHGNRWDQAPRQADGGGGGGGPGPYDMLALAYGGEDRWGRGGGGYGGGGYGNNGGGYNGGFGNGYGGSSGGSGGYGANPPPPPGGYPGGGSQPPLPGARSSGYGGVFSGSRGGEQHIVKMRGLPFKATEMEIAEWFSSAADAQDINIMHGSDGRPSGQAEVTFKSAEDAKAAMTKHRQNMQNRYIELFYNA